MSEVKSLKLFTDDRKSRGFYVDYRNKTWIPTTEITEEDYLLSKTITWRLVLLIKAVNQTGAMMLRESAYM
jgi:hypothetical protein